MHRVNRDAPNSAAQAAMQGGCLCQAARGAARAITRRYDAGLAAHGLTVGQFSILAVLAAAEGQGAPVNVRRLSRVLDLEQSATSRAVAALTCSGWVIRAPDPRDGRARVLRLGDGAWAKFNAAARTWAELQEAEVARD
ncbi:MAG: MarR family transcriptional regulator [Pseudomonadota bacterium]